MNETISKIEEKVKTGAKITFQNLPFIFIIILTFILTGLTELIKPGFNWQVFLTSNYWFNTVLVAVSGFLISIASAVSRANTLRFKDVDGKFSEANKALATITPKIQDSTLDTFISEMNRKRKIQAFKEKLTEEFHKIEKSLSTNEEIEYIEFNAKNNLLEEELKAKYEDENEYFNQFYMHTLKNLKGHSKKVQKKVICLLKMNDLYIENNIDKLKVKYTRITHKLISVGTKGNVDDGMPNKGSKVLIDGLLPRILLSFSITTTLLTFAFDIERLSWLAIIPILIKVISLIGNFIYGFTFAPTYVEQVYLDEIYVKIRWLTLFNEWKKKKGLQ